MHIVAFSKYLAHNIGGAEHSTRALLTNASKNGDDVHVVALENACFLGQPVPMIDLPKEWRISFVPDVIQLSRFSYVEYLLNRARIARFFSNMDADELWAYGTFAPSAMLGFHGKKRYFVRSETDLGIVGNYFNGIRRFAKQAYVVAESPATTVYRRDLRRVLQSPETTVVANSGYMSKRAQELLGVNAEVVYPRVNVEVMQKLLDESATESQWVVFVGDASYKGIDLVLEVANKLKEARFRIFSRFVSVEHNTGNILWSPWTTEGWRVYDGARLVIVPSQCEEAYGKVAREAYLLGIPVLVSSVGGLPEAVDWKDEHIVGDFRSADAWASLIAHKVLGHDNGNK